jgi:arylformamidase
MRILDLSHPISEKMPVYPGTEQPRITTGCSIEQDGFLEKKITLYSHTGTHIDAPAHLLPEGATLDRLPIDHFYGTAAGLHLPERNGKTIGIDLVRQTLSKRGGAPTEFLLIYTGWERFWREDRYFTEYPVLSPDAAEWLGTAGLKGVGFDTLSADAADTKDYPVHKILLRRNIIIIENLCSLASLPAGPFHFSCFPLRFLDADGSPVRAAAYIDGEED